MQPRIILIAPSWQKDNILESCLEETLKPLLATGYRIVVRPHPEFVKRFPAKIRAIRKCDHYKGKGIKYAGEKIRLKAGKSGKVGGKGKK